MGIPPAATTPDGYGVAGVRKSAPMCSPYSQCRCRANSCDPHLRVAAATSSSIAEPSRWRSIKAMRSGGCEAWPPPDLDCIRYYWNRASPMTKAPIGMSGKVCMPQSCSTPKRSVRPSLIIAPRPHRLAPPPTGVSRPRFKRTFRARRSRAPMLGSDCP